MKIKVSHDYLLKLANNELKDNEILKGYFKYYFCQDRNISDLKIDFMNAGNPMKNKNVDCIFFQDLSPEQIKNSIENLENVLNEFLINTFNLSLMIRRNEFNEKY